MCTVHDARKHEKYARQSHSVAPKFILCGIGMGVFKPLTDLLFGLGFASADDSCIGIPYLFPITDILDSCIRLIKTHTPPIREALETSTLNRGKPSYCIACVKNAVVVTGASSVDEGVATILKEVVTEVT